MTGRGDERLHCHLYRRRAGPLLVESQRRLSDRRINPGRHRDPGRDKQEAKEVANVKVNGAVADPKKVKVKAALEGIDNLPPSQWGKIVGGLRKYGPNVLGALGAIATAASAANAAQNGSRNGHTGALGAADQALADLMNADLVEDYVLEPVGEAIGDYVDDKIKGNLSRKRTRDAGFDENLNPID